MIDRRDPRRRRNRPTLELLEDRRLLASLAPIANLSVPAQQGYSQPLDGSGTADAQIFRITRTSGSADITASIPQGPFWTINVQYTDPNNAANNFSGPLVFQLFQDLTPNTVSQIQTFTNNGYYTGKNFTRITGGFPTANDFIVQAGAPNTNGTGNSGQPNTPFLNENAQSLAFTGMYQLAMANAGVNTSLPNASQGVNTDDSQFFVTTTGAPNVGLGYGYTIFGQLLSGQATLTKMTQVPRVYNSVYGETSLPANPIIMSALSLSTTNPSGVALIDTSQARPGETATFQVTATDPTDGGTVTRSFTVTAGTYTGPTDPAIDFKPLADPVSATVADDSSTNVALVGHDGYPDVNYPGTLSYTLVSQPSHGTLSQFNATTGTFVYTPVAGYSGPDSIQYEVQENGPPPPIGKSRTTGQWLFGPAVTTTSAPATVTLTVTPAAGATTPTINWSNPAAITYGTALSNTQLNAQASVPGTYSYSPAPGTVLKAGAGQTLSVTFTPTDIVNYTATSATVSINVDRTTPTINWSNPADIIYGHVLSGTQLNATASVPGTLVYTPAAGKVVKAGAGQTLSVAFTPTDLDDYTTATARATINVSRATPTITWANPAGISYGTALSSTQLNAQASVPGTYSYSPAPGTVLKAGAGQTLSVTFTPTDTVDYVAISTSVTIDVARATPAITWSRPAGITVGTALGLAQLNALTTVPGTFSYAPAAGTVLNAGAGQVLSVVFTPTDLANYTTATAVVTIDVAGTTATPASTGTPTPLGPVTSVDHTTRNKNQVSAVTLTFIGSIDASMASNPANYQLVKQGKHGLFIAKGKAKIKIKSVSYDPSSHTVTLIPRKRFALTKPVQVLIGGKPAGTL